MLSHCLFLVIYIYIYCNFIHFLSVYSSHSILQIIPVIICARNRGRTPSRDKQACQEYIAENSESRGNGEVTQDTQLYRIRPRQTCVWTPTSATQGLSRSLLLLWALPSDQKPVSDGLTSCSLSRCSFSLLSFLRHLHFGLFTSASRHLSVPCPGPGNLLLQKLTFHPPGLVQAEYLHWINDSLCTCSYQPLAVTFGHVMTS